MAPATAAGTRVLLDWVPSSSVSRPATARPRWIRIIRLMYAASASPRDSSISARIASSSRPSCSTSSSVRWVYSLTSEMAMSFSFSVVRCDGASNRFETLRCRACSRRRRRVTQVCTGSLGWSNSSPLRRSRIVPETMVIVQVWQMPIRQP